MNRQNTVLIKQFPEHTQKTAQEIINMLFTWNGKEKIKVGRTACTKTRVQHSKAALTVRYKIVMLCILSLQIWRPWDLPKCCTHRGKAFILLSGHRHPRTYVHGKTLEEAVVCSLLEESPECVWAPWMSVCWGTTAQRSGEQGQGKPKPHTLSVQTA